MNILKLNGVLILVLGFIFFSACSEEESDPNYIEVESPYDRVGRLHNEGLDYVLEKITKTFPMTKSGKRKIPGMGEIRKMCHDFAQSKGYEVTTKNGMSIRDSVEDFSFLSESQYQWLEKIKKTVWGLTPESVEKFSVTLKSLEQQLEQDKVMSATEKEILFYTMAVCRYSAHYWINNYEKWQIELYGINRIPHCKIRTRTRSEETRTMSKEWWETYKTIVWKDGSCGIMNSDGYYLVDATVGSVNECL